MTLEHHRTVRTSNVSASHLTLWKNYVALYITFFIWFSSKIDFLLSPWSWWLLLMMTGSQRSPIRPWWKLPSCSPLPSPSSLRRSTGKCSLQKTFRSQTDTNKFVMITSHYLKKHLFPSAKKKKIQVARGRCRFVSTTRRYHHSLYVWFMFCQKCFGEFWKPRVFVVVWNNWGILAVHQTS